MEKIAISIAESKKYLKIADHMLTITYPIVNDPKLLLTVLENLFLALAKSITAILYYERHQKNIPPFHDNFESKFNNFKYYVAPKYNIDSKNINMVEDIKEIIMHHKNSPVEFVRKGVFVICSDDYKIKTLNTNEVKKYIQNTKVFIASIFNNIKFKNDRIIR